MVGVQLGEWVVDGELGRGSWGVVYRVRHHQQTTRQMAVKLLTDPRAKDPAFHLRFQAEMAVLRRLDHPHIVKYYDHGLHEGYPYYVMELVEGTGYDQQLRERQRIPWEEVLTISIQIVAALRYAHRRGILHRSLKPSNVLHLAPGQVKIGDFGMLKLLAEASAMPTASPVLEPVYSSPEQLSGKALSKRSDFYSYGTLLYTLLVGRPPFAAANFVEVVQKVCFTLPERPIHYLPDLPEEIDALVTKLLSKEPAHRPGSGTLLLRELERIWSDLERKQRLGKRPEFPPSGSDADVALGPEIEEESHDYVSVPAEERRWPKAVLLVLGLSGVVAVLVWAFFFRGESAESLIAQARPLMESSKVEDWEKAWDDHLSKLVRNFPDQATEEVKECKFRVERVRELRGSVLGSRPRQYQSEAERFYDEGYRLCKAGDVRNGRLRWQHLLAVFRDDEGERKWVFAAQLGLQLVTEKKPDERVQLADAQRVRQELQREVDRVRQFRGEGNATRADELRKALEALYEGHPAFEEFRAELNPK